MPPSLPNLPHEVLHHVLKDVDPEDIPSVSRTSRALKAFVSRNLGLFKGMICNYWDEPMGIFKPPTLDWERELRDFIRLRISLGGSHSIEEKVRKLDFVAQKCLYLVRTASPQPGSLTAQFLTKHFDIKTPIGKQNIEAFLCRSTTFARAWREETPHYQASFLERQLSARLHCHYGVPVMSPNRSRYADTYPYACSMVYDLRNYTHDNLWGPFLDSQARADWERIEAVMIVLRYNIRMLDRHVVQSPWLGASPDTFKSTPLVQMDPPVQPVNPEDPYNITGTWTRIVCFLDYHEFFHYNFMPDGTLPDDSREPREPLNTTEATRFIAMDLRVTKIEDPGPEDGQDFPVVYFKGTSRSMHIPHDPDADSNIRGTVRQTLEGEVRWTSYSVFNGEERWKSEGIQVGGPRSSLGVIGHWFDRDMDPHGPTGPTMFWKVSNEIDDLPSEGLLANFEEWVMEDDEEEEEEAEEEGEGEEGEEGEEQEQANDEGDKDGSVVFSVLS